MKKGFIPVMLSCLMALGAAAGCTVNDAYTESHVFDGGDKEEDSNYAVSIANKADLQAEWRATDPARDLSINTEPKANVRQLLANGTIEITSSNPQVAVVSGLKLTPVGEGTTTITVKCGKSQDTVEITVLAPVHGTLAEDPLTVAEAREIASKLDNNVTTEVSYYVEGVVLSATAWNTQYKNIDITLVGASAEETFVLYRATNDSTLSFDMTQMKAGLKVKAYGMITKYNNQLQMASGGKVVKVEEVSLDCTDIQLDRASVTAEVGAVERVVATPLPLGTGDTVTFESTATSICTVDNSGRIKGVAAGDAFVNVKCGNITKQISVSVVAATNGPKTLEIIDHLTLADTLTSTKPASVEQNTLTQTVPGVADEFSVVFDGQYYIPGTYENSFCSANADDNIHAAAGSNIYVHKLIVDTRKYLNLEIFKTNDCTGDKVPYTAIPGSGVVGVDEHAKVEYIINSKTWSIRANYSGAAYTHSLQFTVDDEPMPLQFTGVEFPSETVSLVKGVPTSVAAKALEEGVSGVTLSYESDHPELVSVDNSGVLTALKGSGSATITVTATNGDATFTDTLVANIAGEVMAVEDPQPGSQYYLALEQKSLNKVLYDYATKSGNYGGTKEDYNEAVKYELVQVSGGYNLKACKADGSFLYLNGVVSGDYFNVMYESEAKTAWELDKTNKIIKYNVTGLKTSTKDGYYFLGTNGTYATISTYAISNASNANYYHLWFYDIGQRPTATKVSAASNNVTVEAGKTLPIELTFEPAGAKPEMTWTSADESICKVENGAIVGIAKGSTTITGVTENFVDDSTTPDLKIVLNVEVTKPYEFVGQGTLASPYTIEDAWNIADTLEHNQTTEKEVYVKGYVTKIASTDANYLKYGDVDLWAADTPDGAQDYFEVYHLYGYNGGLLTSLKDVEVGDLITVLAKIKRYNSTHETDSCKLVDITKATSHSLESIALDKETATVTAGSTTSLVATLVPSVPYANQVVWTSDDETVATVENGVVTGVKAGTATITATAGGKSATCTVTVKAASSTPVEFTDSFKPKDFESCPSSYTTDGTEYNYKSDNVTYAATGINSANNIRGNKTANGGNFNLRNTVNMEGYYVSKIVIKVTTDGGTIAGDTNRSVLILGSSAFSKIADTTVPTGSQISVVAGTGDNAGTYTWTNSSTTASSFILYSLKTSGTVVVKSIEVTWTPVPTK